jgi:hypothetical protein
MKVSDTISEIKKPKKKFSKEFIIIFFLIIVLIFAWAGLTKAGYLPNYFYLDVLSPNYNSHSGGGLYFEKPVIYLYPPSKQDIKVQFDYQGKIISDYPEYDESIHGWEVTAYPDGKIINQADNKEYSYLFWEGKPRSAINWDMSTGFLVKGSDTREFLQKILSEIGLTPKEYNEFIVYWYPLMKGNEYNLINFAEKQYTDLAPLNITPKPDSMLRVFMVYKPEAEYSEIKPQTFKPFIRNGFTVVEWGGMEIK